MEKILVIEDDAPVRENIIELLAAEGFTALGAENGAQGLRLARQQHPDLILCDIVMPGMDGYGVLAVLNQEKSALPVPFIFLTARVAREDARKGMELGTDDYLTKPFTRQELLNAIFTRLAKKKQMVEEVSQKLGDQLQSIAFGFPHRVIAPLSLILQSSEAIAGEAEMLQLDKIKAKANTINRSARSLSHTIQNLLLLVELDSMNIHLEEYETASAALSLAGHKIIEETILEASKSYDRLTDLEYVIQEGVMQVPEIHLQKIIEEIADIIFVRTPRGVHVKVLGEIKPPYQSYSISFFVPGEGFPAENVVYINNVVYRPNFLPEYMEPSLDWFVAKRLVELYKGSIVLDSVLGIGTTLSVTMPLNVML